ncbi:hypothetical protein EII47_30730, partial [Klebsiella pneumoniae]|nr:hypothetical protein [Klebsiella pneumoniae]
MAEKRPTSQNRKITKQRRCLVTVINYMLIFGLLNVIRGWMRMMKKISATVAAITLLGSVSAYAAFPAGDPAD